MTERAQKCVAAARNVAEGSPTLGKLIREGRNPMITKTYYEYAAVIRAAVECVYPDYLEREEHNPSGKFVAWKRELLAIADEIEKL